MKRYIRSQHIPDMTERFPEGLRGRDMYDIKTPEEAFWDLVDRAEAAEGEEHWVSFATQDGRQHMTTMFVPSRYDTYSYIESRLLDEYGDDLAEIADYGFNEEVN